MTYQLRLWLLAFCLSSMPPTVLAQVKEVRRTETAPATAESSAPARSRAPSAKNWRLMAEAGFSITPYASNVGSQWKQSVLESPTAKLSAAYLVKTRWNVWFTFSPDLVFVRSVQRVSSSRAASTLQGQYLFVGGSAGVIWRPQALNELWSFSGYVGFPVTSVFRETSLISPGYTSAGVDAGDGFLPIWGGARAGYRFMDDWEAHLGWFAISGANGILLGVSHAP